MALVPALTMSPGCGGHSGAHAQGGICAVSGTGRAAVAEAGGCCAEAGPAPGVPRGSAVWRQLRHAQPLRVVDPPGPLRLCLPLLGVASASFDSDGLLRPPAAAHVRCAMPLLDNLR